MEHITTLCFAILIRLSVTLAPCVVLPTFPFFHVSARAFVSVFLNWRD